MIDPDFSILETVLQSKFDVLTQGLAFLLCQARHNGKQHLTLGIHGVDILFFKENRDVLFLQFPNIFQAIQGVSGKPADGLGNDHINVSVHAVLDHAVKFLPLFRICSSDPVISINPGQFPFRILLDKLRIMRHLHLIAGCLLLTIRGNPAVSGDFQLWSLFRCGCVSKTLSGRDHSDIPTQFHPYPPHSQSNYIHTPPVQRDR